MSSTRLKPYYDFCFDERNVYLTSIGKSRISHRYVSPSKIINFFNEKTEFKVWKSLFLPEDIRIQSTTESENYFFLEEEIRNYLRDRSGLNLDFFGYGFWEENVFPVREGIESKLGGVPDGLSFSKEGEILSVLEIKLNSSYKSTLSQEWFSYLLQTSLYMYLSGVNIGYICILEKNLSDVYLNAIQDVHLNSPLKKVSENKECFEKKTSVVLGEFEIKYEIMGEYENDFNKDTRLHLFKIRLNTKELSPMFQKMCEWWNSNSSKSPDMNKEDLERILKYSYGNKAKYETTVK